MLKVLNLIGMYVADTEASVSFYKQLGFEVASNDGSVAEVKLGDVRLQFVAQETANNKTNHFKKMPLENLKVLVYTSMLRWIVISTSTTNNSRSQALPPQLNRKIGHGDIESLWCETLIGISWCFMRGWVVA